MLLRTRDHSFLEQAHSRLTQLESVNRNILFTCLGSPIKPVFDMAGPLPLLQGDKLLLCSDGLWGSLTDAEIVHRLAGRHVSESVPELVQSALRTAGEHCDNVTVLALEWETPDAVESRLETISTETLIPGGFQSTYHIGSCT